jgi:hypothetical protein
MAMIRNTQPAMLAATAIVSLAIGFGAATLLPSRSGPIEPIIDTEAWQEAAPAVLDAQPASLTARPVRVAACSQWDVSDAAMEEVLDEMIRRGWRPPTQGDAIAAMDVAQTAGLSATDPSAPMPYRRTWTSQIASDEDAPVNEDATAEAAPADQPTPPAEAEKPAPPPA